jgi:hypothetical protein
MGRGHGSFTGACPSKNSTADDWRLDELSRPNEEESFALVSLYTAPDATMLTRSHGTLWSCEYQDETALKVIPVKSIISVVGMVPHKTDRFFVTEKLGLEVAFMGGAEEEMTEGE